MKHVVFFSGGAGSFATVIRLLDQGVKVEDLHLLFTDTQFEDRELYRFIIDAFEYIFKADLSSVKPFVDKLTEVEHDLDKRKKELSHIQSMIKIPNVHWLRYEVDGIPLSPWDIFYNDEFIGNSRVANCSKILKQRMARDYIRDNFIKEETSVYLGIDWSESHRTTAPVKNWSKYATHIGFPMTEAPYLLKDDIIGIIKKCGIDIPLPYLQGQPHLNCGSFCVRGGHGHFARLHELHPERFEYHARKERELCEIIQKKNKSNEVYSILKQAVNGEVISVPLDDLKNQLIEKKSNVDMFDIGGCGCFVTDDSEEIEETHMQKWGLRDLVVVR